MSPGAGARLPAGLHRPPGRRLQRQDLTPYLTHGTARTLNGLAALLVVAGLILVAQVSAPQIGWAGGRVGSRGWRCSTSARTRARPARRRGHRRSKTTTRLHQTPIRTDVDVQREDGRRPERPRAPEEERHPVAQDQRGARRVGTRVLRRRLPRQPPRRPRGKDGRDGRRRVVADPVGAEATRSLRRRLRRRHAPKGRRRGGRSSRHWRSTHSCTKTSGDRTSASGKGRRGKAPKGRGCSSFETSRRVGGVGLGHQQEYLARWLMFGMATRRAVFFQFCAEDGEPWGASPERVQSAPAPRATYVGMDISTSAIISV